MAEQEKVKRSIKEENKLRKDKCDTGVVGNDLKCRELPCIPCIPTQQNIVLQSPQLLSQIIPQLTPQLKMSIQVQPCLPSSTCAEIYPSVVTTSADKMDEQCTKRRFLSHLGKLLQFDQKTIDLNRSQLEHNRVLLENNRTMLECNRLTALRVENVSALIQYGDTLLDTNSSIMTNSERLLSHNVLLMEHSAKLIKHMHRLNADLSAQITDNSAVDKSTISSTPFELEKSDSSTKIEENNIFADVHVTSANSLGNTKDSCSLAVLNTHPSPSTNQIESTLSALIQSHSSMTATTNQNDPCRESPDSGHSGSINDFDDPACPLTAELRNSWCTLAKDEITKQTVETCTDENKFQTLVEVVDSPADIPPIVEDISTGENHALFSDFHTIDNEYEPETIISEFATEKKKRGFLAAIMKPFIARTRDERLSKRPLSVPGSVAAILAKNECSSVSRSRSYHESRVSRLQSDKYISNGTAPLIGLDNNE